MQEYTRVYEGSDGRVYLFHFDEDNKAGYMDVASDQQEAERIAGEFKTLACGESPDGRYSADLPTQEVLGDCEGEGYELADSRLHDDMLYSRNPDDFPGLGGYFVSAMRDTNNRSE